MKLNGVKICWKTARNFQSASVFNVVLLKATLPWYVWYVVCWLDRNDSILNQQRLLRFPVPLVSLRISIVDDWHKEKLGPTKTRFTFQENSYFSGLLKWHEMQDSPSKFSPSALTGQPVSHPLQMRGFFDNLYSFHHSGEVHILRKVYAKSCKALEFDVSSTENHTLVGGFNPIEKY